MASDDSILNRIRGFYRHLLGRKVPYVRISQNLSEVAILWGEWRTSEIYDKFEKKSYTVPPDIKPVAILERHKPLPGFIVDGDKGTAVNLERHPDLIRMVGNPELHGNILDAGLINSTYRITPSGREIWVQRIVFLILGGMLGASFV